jgi:hypothetical protein
VVTSPARQSGPTSAAVAEEQQTGDTSELTVDPTMTR